MTVSIPRMRMFAGPNGSGKSTINAVIRPELLGVYINRVKTGGHPVPEDKIVSRYFRSLALLREVICYSNRAYIFDNSGQQQVFVAEITDGHTLELKTERMPNWFKHAVLDKIGGV